RPATGRRWRRLVSEGPAGGQQRLLREGPASRRRIADRWLADQGQGAVEVHGFGQVSLFRDLLRVLVPSLVVLPFKRALFLAHGSIVLNMIGCAHPRLTSGTRGCVPATRTP